MANISTNQFRGGLKIMLDGEPHAIVENEFVKPGKGQAFNRVKVRNLTNGRVIERTFKSGDSVEQADVLELEMQYLYNDGNFWYFMDPESFEQVGAEETAVGEAQKWLKEQDICKLVLWGERPIDVEPPNHVTLKVIETDPGVRGDTSSGGVKPARLETGVVVRVPLFIETGETLKIDTRKGEYISRA